MRTLYITFVIWNILIHTIHTVGAKLKAHKPSSTATCYRDEDCNDGDDCTDDVCILGICGHQDNGSCTHRLRRSFKRGMGFSIAHGCDVLDNHHASSWWYSWKPTTGFARGYCNDPTTANANARKLGFEFIPMLHPGIPPRPFEEEIVENLQNANYLFTINEPERELSGNVTGYDAAMMWPEVVEIAKEYKLPIVAPCSTSKQGLDWYDEWLSECDTLYGKPCEFDFSCFHMYLYPWPCDVELPNSNTCAGDEGWRVNKYITDWYDTYGKPVWITEFACNAGLPCDEDSNAELMKQLVPLLDYDDRVYRYAWFSANRRPGNTNERVFENTVSQSCKNTIWLTEAKEHGDCYRAALKNADCRFPLNLVYNDEIGTDCYCSTDDCEETLPSDLKIFRQEASYASSSLTALGHLYQTIYSKSTESPSVAPSRAPLPAPSPAPIRPASLSPSTVPTPTPLDCPPNKSYFKVSINTDNRGYELRYSLHKITLNGEVIEKNILSNKKLASDTQVIEEKCISSSACYRFKIVDDGGDGICCTTETGNGMYKLIVDGEVIRESQFSKGKEMTKIGNCAPTISPVPTPAVLPTKPPKAPTASICPFDRNHLKVLIKTDNNGKNLKYDLVKKKISGGWSKQKVISGRNLPNNDIVENEACLSPTRCYRFRIRDSQGNGLCCSKRRDGYYTLLLNGKVKKTSQFIDKKIEKTQIGAACWD